MKRHVTKKSKMDDLPLEEKAEMALKEAVADAIAEHKLRGHPIIVWRNGKVVAIPPEEIILHEKDKSRHGTSVDKNKQIPTPPRLK